jgi:hypothetical protein
LRLAFFFGLDGLMSEIFRIMPAGEIVACKHGRTLNLFFHSSFFLHHFPDDAAQRRAEEIYPGECGG